MWIQWRIQTGLHGTPPLKGCLRKYYVCYTPTLRALTSPAAYADNQLLCSLCSPKCTHNNKVQQQVCRPTFFTTRLHQKRSQRVRNPKFSWGACPQTPLVGVLSELQLEPLFKILDPALRSKFQIRHWDLQYHNPISCTVAADTSRWTPKAQEGRRNGHTDRHTGQLL